MEKLNSRIAIVLSLVLLCALFIPASGNAGLPLPPLPPKLFLPVPPPVLLIPGTYAYFAPDVSVDIIFYQGAWYRPYEGRWYSASHYNGPWGFIELRRVPRMIVNLPPGYRNAPAERQRIPYGQLKKNWRAWEHDRHWDKPAKNKENHGGSHKVKHGKSEHGREKGHGKGH